SLPSLSGWGEEYRTLVRRIVDEFYRCLEAIELNDFLDSTQIRLMRIGFYENEDGEWITPFHPLVLAYYLELAQNAITDGDQSYLNLPGITLARLNPQGLLPYIYHDKHDFSYVQALEENTFWLQC